MSTTTWRKVKLTKRKKKFSGKSKKKPKIFSISRILKLWVFHFIIIIVVVCSNHVNCLFFLYLLIKTLNFVTLHFVCVCVCDIWPRFSSKTFKILKAPKGINRSMRRFFFDLSIRFRKGSIDQTNRKSDVWLKQFFSVVSSWITVYVCVCGLQCKCVDHNIHKYKHRNGNKD